MSKRQARTAATVVLTLAALALAALAVLVVHGVTVEYGGGSLEASDLVVFAGVPVAVALLAALAWPRHGAPQRLVAAGVFAVVVAVALGGATALGERQNGLEQQLYSDRSDYP